MEYIVLEYDERKKDSDRVQDFSFNKNFKGRRCRFSYVMGFCYTHGIGMRNNNNEGIQNRKERNWMHTEVI